MPFEHATRQPFPRTAMKAIAALLILHIAHMPAAGWGQLQPIQHPFSQIQLPTRGVEYCPAWESNDSGMIVGEAYLFDASGDRALLWGPHGVVALGSLGGPKSSARAINNVGWIVGESGREGEVGSQVHPVLWRNGEVIALNELNYDYGRARGVNDSGRIVGSLFAEGLPRRAVRWDRNGIVLLPSLWGEQDDALAINSAGTVVGQSWSSSHSGWRPILWDESGAHDLGTLRSDNSGRGWASDINDAGYVVGNASVRIITSHAFIWFEGKMHDIDPRPDRSSVALSINNRNEVIGNSGENPFYWSEQQGMRWLRDIAPPRAQYLPTDARDINDSSEMVVIAAHVENSRKKDSFRLFPIHPTIMLHSAVPGIAGRLNRISVSNAAPGTTVGFFYSRHGGGSLIPGCPPRRNTLQIDDPQLLGTAIADAEGRATIVRFVPPHFAGETVLVQAAVRAECAISELLVQEFE